MRPCHTYAITIHDPDLRKYTGADLDDRLRLFQDAIKLMVDFLNDHTLYEAQVDDRYSDPIDLDDAQ